ncbi:EAL domain-containing protein [Streptomyces sp. NBC_00885]|uniref:putative bifunctional diguanylate cyclase/phosphodiesterase n=1 Tax=Streptomyces sp. NBC_00885 TaxID=2975857 RepID=UPI00386CE016|nr:EAL domain-containing protein [Streptomyces sp. NBC_00885]
MNPRLRSLATMAAVSACIILLTALYYTFPQHRLIFVGIGAIGVIGIALGVFLNRPAHRLPWLLLAAGNFAFAAGQATQIILIDLLQEEMPFPSIADGFYLAAYPLYAAGLLGFVHWRTGWRDRASLVDALTLTVGLALLSWIFLIDPLAHIAGLTWVQKAFSIAYPLGDILVLAMLVRLLAGRGGRSPALMLLTAGTVGLLVADVAYGLIQLNGTWRTGSVVELGWAVLYGAWAAAALHPSMRSLTQPVAWRGETGVGRLSLLTLASLIAPAILLIEALRGVRSNVGVIGVFSAVLFVLVLYRLAGVAATHRQAVGREKVLRIAVSSLGGAGDVRDVAASAHLAVTELMPHGPPRSALLTPPDNTLWVNGAEGGVRGPAAERVTAAVRELTASGENRLVTLDGLGPDLADCLTSQDEEPSRTDQALVCPLSSQDHPSGDPLIGALIVAGDEQDLLVLRETLATLAAQTALAVARVGLAQEVNRRNSEVYFRTLVQNASDVILILDDDDRIRYASPSADQVLGIPDLEGTLLIDLVPPQDSRGVVETLGRIRTREHQGRREHWRMVRTDRATIEVEVRWSDLREEATVGGVVLTLQDVTEQRKLERELTHQAFHDPLTGLANRILFQERVNHALVQAQRDGTVVGVLFVDVDDFKVVNDIHGHSVGDELLVALSLRLSTTVRASDTAARIGGDEFALLVEGSIGPEGVERFTENVMTVFAETFRLSVGPVSTYASIGVATTEDSIDSVELLTHADLALYAAKTAGKRQWRRYQPELQSGMAERAKLQEGLDSSPIETSFLVLYQPIVELASGRISGFEALVRWPSTRGMVLPEQFITLAEESGQIVPLGAWVLDQAAAEAVRWQDSVLRDGTADRIQPYVSVNVSPRQFRDAEFYQVIRRALDLSGIEPSSLVLELTESVLMYNDERILREMSALTDLGIRIAIDDFGTGYSSLSYLREFPISILKIDKSFVDELGRSPEQYALVEGITHLADTLGLTVIAEGVEDVRQQELLASMGCKFGQGYLFAEPVSAEEAEQLVLAPPLGRLTGLPEEAPAERKR